MYLVYFAQKNVRIKNKTLNPNAYFASKKIEKRSLKRRVLWEKINGEKKFLFEQKQTIRYILEDLYKEYR